MNPDNQNPYAYRPAYRPTPTAPLSPQSAPTKKNSGGLKLVLIIFLSILLIGTLALLGYLYSEYLKVSKDVETKISIAVANAEKEVADKKEAEFAKREKEPYSTFSGPVNYGELSFSYPKTWSVYVEEDASSNGDFVAYLNPAQVEPKPKEGINALRVTIKNSPYDTVLSEYNKYVEDGLMVLNTIKVNNETASYFRTTDNEKNKWQGAVVLIRIRDKTVFLQTDSELFLDDFDNIILKTTTYNA